ncbi:ABC transporter substrate-binding protein [Alicyclobacillus mengziensis]|uniref:ABC transporter substrate-binding protein n=1 Tax=Alicyclobacillus mengziensis TaxID=2931921 RepID=A0A9X7VWW7_9BACL|nr:ABC transporter substrate-binding protein [Alicyclobacillus mengziensis]QSO46558.1 ABC transporter substrate-binding protein [Alicyclobacillus mengziensis]
MAGRTRMLNVMGVVSAAALMLSACGTSSTSTNGNGATTQSTASSASGNGASSQVAKPVLKVGLVFPLTGAFSALGTTMYHGVEMALKQVNANGGVDGAQIQLFTADSQSNPQVAATEAQKLISQDHVQVIMGSYASSLSQTISTVAERNHVVMWEVGAVANNLTQNGYKYYFRSVGNATSYAVADVQFLNNVLIPKLHKTKKTIRIAVTYENDSFGTSVADNVIKLLKSEDGITPVAVEGYPVTATSLDSVVLKLKQSQPDVLFATPLVSDGLLLYQTMQHDSFNVPAFIGSAAMSSPAFIQKFGAKGVQGVFDVEPPSASGLNPAGLSPQGQKLLTNFVQDYEAKYNSPPLIHAGLGYLGGWAVGTKLLPAAVKLAHGSTPTEQQIREAATQIDVSSADSPLGYGIKFSSTGNDVLGASDIMQWQNGKLVVVWPSNVALAKPEVPMPTWSQR